MVAVTTTHGLHRQRSISTGRRATRLVVVGAKVVLVAVVAFLVWHELAPGALGGNDSYVVTDGTSMLPTIKGGSLVVVRRQPVYRVGEIAAYDDKQLRSVVLHRITAINGGNYTFKGDNNPYPDAIPATKADIIGAKWVYSPRMGRLLSNLRKPYLGALVLGLTGMWVAAEKPPRDKARHRRRGQ